ncbi:MAG TPA: hypothetical protein VJ783_07680 [Pirellulales bacterium]|nr:hypothetical protein [Pirellulales bacterium]
MNCNRRSGFTVIECCAAAALLAAALTVVVSLLTSVARQRLAAAWQAQAVIEADNLLERLTAEPYVELTGQHVAAMNLNESVAERLPNGAVEAQIDEEAGPPGRKRIEVEISWHGPRSEQARRHRVVTWVYARDEEP